MCVCVCVCVCPQVVSWLRGSDPSLELSWLNNGYQRLLAYQVRVCVCVCVCVCV